MQLRDHTAVQSKRDYFTVDPRELKIDATYNVRDLTSLETRAHIEDLKASIAVNGVRVALEVRLEGEDIQYIMLPQKRNSVFRERQHIRKRHRLRKRFSREPYQPFIIRIKNKIIFFGGMSRDIFLGFKVHFKTLMIIQMVREEIDENPNMR